MKNKIELNIGLSGMDGRTVHPERVAWVLKECGFIITASRLCSGTWEGKPEQALALECLVALPLCHHECRLAVAVALRRVAENLMQSCVAVKWPWGVNELIPPVAAFDPQYWQPVYPVCTSKRESCPEY